MPILSSPCYIFFFNKTTLNWITLSTIEVEFERRMEKMCENIKIFVAIFHVIRVESITTVPDINRFYSCEQFFPRFQET